QFRNRLGGNGPKLEEVERLRIRSARDQKSSAGAEGKVRPDSFGAVGREESTFTSDIPQFQHSIIAAGRSQPVSVLRVESQVVDGALVSLPSLYALPRVEIENLHRARARAKGYRATVR